MGESHDDTVEVARIVCVKACSGECTAIVGEECGMWMIDVIGVGFAVIILVCEGDAVSGVCESEVETTNSGE